jgi:hypothetical protein
VCAVLPLSDRSRPNAGVDSWDGLCACDVVGVGKGEMASLLLLSGLCMSASLADVELEVVSLTDTSTLILGRASLPSSLAVECAMLAKMLL